MGLLYFLYVYVLGGVTFIPLVVAAIFLHARLTLPHIDPKFFQEDFSDPLRDADDEDTYIKSGGAASLDERFRGKHDADLAEGYYAVCREYVPAGVNGKPPERATGPGEAAPEQSPSVYQSMYRSLFDRRQAPTLEPNKTAGRFAKKPRNVFYVVLRHGHLMLYDDEYQSEVRHVISLTHHKIDLYGGGNDIPEGELWIKRNAIRLIRKDVSVDNTSSSKPFYFFSENCSDKEDFYHAMLQNQERASGETDGPPSSLNFENDHIIKLIQKLHSSEEQFQTRWLNALLGRWFLAIYKTKFIEDVLRMKITKKIARVKKPAFLTGIILRNINMGKSAPLITNPRLRDLTMDGNCCVEADFQYDGGIRVEIAATARIDLGARFKAREVQLVLAVTCKKLTGHGMIRFKPPPSNRLWITFETMPKLEMSIEPIWGSRQITYSVVLRQIESRIREVFAETLVFPFWDDIPFLDTEKKRYRGGIWAEDGQGSHSLHETHVPDEAPQDENEGEAAALDQSALGAAEEKSASSPNLVDTGSKGGLFSRRGNRHAYSTSQDSRVASSSAVEKQQRSDMPRPIRSTSSAAAPTLTTSSADSVGVKHEAKASKDAQSLMKEISSRSPPSSPPATPIAVQTSGRTRSKSPLSNSQKLGGTTTAKSMPSISPLDGASDLGISHPSLNELRRDPSPSASLKSHSSAQSSASTQSRASTKLAKLAETLTPSEEHQAHLAAISAAAANASRSWTWGPKKAKHSNSPSISSVSSFFGTSSNSGSGSGTTTPNAQGSSSSGGGGSGSNASASASSSSEPYGRGRPLPPPGTPLPPPEKATTFAGTATSWMGGIKRKSVSSVHGGPPVLPERRSPRPDRQDSVSTVSSTGTNGSETIKRRPVPPPPLPARRTSRAGLLHTSEEGGNNDDVVVVTAPQGVSGSEDETEHEYERERSREKAHIQQQHHHDEEDLIQFDEPGEIRAGAADLDATAQGGISEDAEHALMEADLATPLAAESRRLEPHLLGHDDTVMALGHNEGEHEEEGQKIDSSGNGRKGREELTASEILARQSISPADLETGPV